MVALVAADDRLPRPPRFEGLGGLGRTPAEPDEAGKHAKHEHYLRVREVVGDLDSALFFHRNSMNEWSITIVFLSPFVKLIGAILLNML